ncbi:MAG TPA: AraC family transcriptional regulator [Chitinophaga sp.]|nr:AraC family transcriptional regulator [Chitinophaga sp.]
MPSPLPKINKLLLLEREVPSYVPITNIPREYMPILIPYAGVYFRKDKEAEILSQHIRLGPFSLWMHDVYAREDIVVCPFIPYHLWSLHGLYEDSLRLKVPQAPDFHLEEKEYYLFNLPSSLFKIPIVAETKVLSFHINILPDALRELVPLYPGLAPLVNKPVKGAGCINEYPYHSNALCDFLVQEILSCRYTDSIAYTYLFRICIDIFLNMAAQEDAIDTPLLLSSVLHADKIHQAFHCLAEHPYKIPSTLQLSLMFGLSIAELEQGFQQHFAISLEEFIHMIRMMLVYHLLQNDKLTLPMIAEVADFEDVDEMLIQAKEYYGGKLI